MSKKSFLLFGLLTVLLSCSVKHKTAKEIYQSGKVENFEDFIRVDTGSIDHDSLADLYIYKFDTSLLVKREYTFTYSTSQKTFRDFAFLYNGKLEGKVIVHNPDGSVMMELNFRNGERIN